MRYDVSRETSMKNFLHTQGISVTDEQATLLGAHLRFILRKNKSINLTSITDYAQACVLHVLDSLLVLPELNKAPQGILLDMGSGAGFPGLPLGIVSERSTILLEARQKKTAVLQEFIKEYQKESLIQAIGMRAEDYAQEHAGGSAVITARALTSLPSLLELAAPLLYLKGQLIALKGQVQDEEFIRAGKLIDVTGMAFVSRRSYSLPSGEHREALVYEKIKPAQKKLPRRAGLAQRKPLA
jgi:16S rRNA (guanine527-N7)-methyltransferase